MCWERERNLTSASGRPRGGPDAEGLARAGGFDNRGECVEGFTPGQIPAPHSIDPHSWDSEDAICNPQTELAFNLLAAPEVLVFNQRRFLLAVIAENTSRPITDPANDREKWRAVHHDAVDVIGDSVGRCFDRMMKAHVPIVFG